MDQYQQRDWWIHPADFEELKQGDCEDHALWAWRVLHESGHDVRLMLGRWRGGGHAWVQLYYEKESYIFEATAKFNVPDSYMSDYVPEYSCKRLDNGRFMMFGHCPIMIEATKFFPVPPLSLPKHWLEIDPLIFAGLKSEAHRAIRIAMQGKGSHTREFLDRYFHLREHHPDSFELDDEAYWKDWES